MTPTSEDVYIQLCHIRAASAMSLVADTEMLAIELAREANEELLWAGVDASVREDFRKSAGELLAEHIRQFHPELALPKANGSG